MLRRGAGTHKTGAMNHSYSVPRIALTVLAISVLSFVWSLAAAESGALSTPPPGFTALFNGKDLAGWWGASTENPREWMALAPEALQKKKEASLGDIRK